MSAETKRVQLDMPEQSLARLQALKVKTEATSYNEVVRNALRLYEAMIGEAQQGSAFLIRAPDGTLREYAVF